MIINSIEIENFRCYYGKNTISFNSDGRITLIYGHSGYGKSSFLQFLRWMFYNDEDFGDSNDKPLWNIHAYNEHLQGKPLCMSGKIDFEHLGIKYSLLKERKRDKSNSDVEMSHKLLMMVDSNWVEYNGDIYNKINNILPKALSKYFFLDGEKAREVVLNSKDLRRAILSLFGLDVYENAISHIGTRNKKNSVLGQYSSELASKLSNKAGSSNMSIQELQNTVNELYDAIEDYTNTQADITSEINECKNRRDEILKTLGESTSKDNLEQLIKRNRDLISHNEETIKQKKIQIGNLFYKWYPYLLLSERTSECATLLREKNDELQNNTRQVFQYLNKPLLREIKEKKVCVCGRELDPKSMNTVDGLISIMPPDSYSYTFQQFVSNSKAQIKKSRIETLEYDNLSNEITKADLAIMELEAENKDKMEELQRLGEYSDLISELTTTDSRLSTLSSRASFISGEIAKRRQLYKEGNKMLRKAMDGAKISDEYKEKFDIFELIRKRLESEKEVKEIQVRNILNDCVREVFESLTTQKGIDVGEIDFVNKDFSLRTTFLTGGQQAVDEYSYVIGMIKALQEFEMENNENPIIVDAPFAFTDNKQSEHIIKKLPEISKQTILLTLDLNKIKHYLTENKEAYDFYVLKTNNQQDMTRIERGDINDFII